MGRIHSITIKHERVRFLFNSSGGTWEVGLEKPKSEATLAAADETHSMGLVIEDKPKEGGMDAAILDTAENPEEITPEFSRCISSPPT